MRCEKIGTAESDRMGQVILAEQICSATDAENLGWNCSSVSLEALVQGPVERTQTAAALVAEFDADAVERAEAAARTLMVHLLWNLAFAGA